MVVLRGVRDGSEWSARSWIGALLAEYCKEEVADRMVENGLDTHGYTAGAGVIFRSVLWTMVVLTGTAWAAQTEAREGTIEFFISDANGQPLKSFRIQVRKADQPDVVIRELSAAGGVRLPYGEYLVTGVASLHTPYSRRVLLREERLGVLVGFSFHDSGHSAQINTALRGRVAGGQIDTRITLVRAVAVWGTFQKEARVGNDGWFEMQEVPLGEYLILVLRGGELIASQKHVKTVRNEAAIVDLRSGIRQ